MSNYIERIFVELNLHLSIISKFLDTLLTKYENVFLMGDFNVNKNDVNT